MRVAALFGLVFLATGAFGQTPGDAKVNSALKMPIEICQSEGNCQSSKLLQYDQEKDLYHTLQFPPLCPWTLTGAGFMTQAPLIATMGMSGTLLSVLTLPPAQLAVFLVYLS